MDELENKYNKQASAMHADIEKLYNKHAQKFLKLFREELANYDLKRHKITILAGNGSCSLMVNDGHLHELAHIAEYRKNKTYYSVLEILLAIENNLNWDWCSHLNGETLN